MTDDTSHNDLLIAPRLFRAIDSYENRLRIGYQAATDARASERTRHVWFVAIAGLRFVAEPSCVRLASNRTQIKVTTGWKCKDLGTVIRLRMVARYESCQGNTWRAAYGGREN